MLRSRCRWFRRASSRAAPAAYRPARARGAGPDRRGRPRPRLVAPTAAAWSPLFLGALAEPEPDARPPRPPRPPGRGRRERAVRLVAAGARLDELAVEALHLGLLPCAGRRGRVQLRQRAASPVRSIVCSSASRASSTPSGPRPAAPRSPRGRRPPAAPRPRAGQRIGQAPERGQGAADVPGAARQRRARSLGLGRLGRDRLGRGLAALSSASRIRARLAAASRSASRSAVASP